MGFLAKLKGFDAYVKPEAHLTRKTTSGAIVSLVGYALMAILFLSELGTYLSPRRVTTMGVDITRDELLQINLDITFPGLPCQIISLDALDASGKHEADIGGELHKQRVSSEGKNLGTYESHFEDLTLGIIQFLKPRNPNDPMPHIKHFEEVAKARKEKEGCRVHGVMKVQRVAGNFHISVHQRDWQTLQMVYDKVSDIDVSHVIKRLSFGRDYPGKIEPLNGYERLLDKSKTESGTFKYFLKIVPTTYTRGRKKNVSPQSLQTVGDHVKDKNTGNKGKNGITSYKNRQPPLDRSSIRTNLYSVTEYFTQSKGWSETGLPAVFFIYDLSPVVMEISDAHVSFGHFLARVCAVVGGVFAVTGMVDRWIHRWVEAMGKMS
tara:strand:+ start:14114 stop:15247 length:1134 start_codon:yes stop_codon:yes gene_type:complete